jgi:hypothetical protein
MDPSNVHSEGWFLVETDEGDPRLLPNLNAPPPRKEECESFQKAILRVKKFYEDGASKQQSHMDQLKEERDVFKFHQARVDAQLKALEPHPKNHPTRK